MQNVNEGAYIKLICSDPKEDKVYLKKAGFVKRYSLDIALIFLAFSQLAIIHQSGLFNDDSHALIHVNLPSNSYWGEVSRATIGHISIGRFIPLHYFFVYTVALIFGSNVFLYKSFLIFSTLFNIVLMGKLVLQITGSQYQKIAVMLFIPLFFQIYNYHCPLTSYFSLIQTLLTLLTLSLSYIIKYIEHGLKSYYIFSFICYLCSILIYELAYFFFPIVLGIIFTYVHAKYDQNPSYGESARRTLKNALPFLIMIMISLGITLYIRNFIVEEVYSGVDLSFDIHLVVRNFFTQMLTAFPLSYFWFIMGGFSQGILIFITNIQIQDLYITLLFLLLIYKIKMKQHNNIDLEHLQPNNSANVKLTFLGVGLYLLPSIPYALSTRYQQLPLGIAYLNIYLQYFGLLILIIAFSKFAQSKMKSEYKPRICKLVQPIFVVCVCVVIILNQQNARIHIESQNERFLYRFEIIEKAISYQNILENFCESNILVVPNTSRINEFYRIPMYARKSVNTISVSDFLMPVNNDAQTVHTITSLEDTYSLTSFATKGAGMLVFARIDNVLHDNFTGKISLFFTKNIQVYIPRKNGATNAIFFNALEGNMLVDRILKTSSLELIGEDRFGRLYLVELEEPAIIGSLSLMQDFSNTSTLGFYMALIDDAQSTTVHSMAFSGSYRISVETVEIHPNTIMFGPYINLEKGQFLVTFKGESLDSGYFDVCSHALEVYFELKDLNITPEKVQFIIDLDENYQEIEFRCRNIGEETLILKSLTVRRLS